MKVLLSLTYFYPYISGLSIYAKRWCELLESENCKITVLCMRHDKELKGEENIGKTRVIRAKPWFKVSKGFISGEYFVRAANLVRQADVVVVNLPQFEGFIPSIWAKIFGKPVIVIYHCDVILPGQSWMTKVVQRVIYAANFLTMWSANKIVTNTWDYAQHSEQLKPFLNKVLTIYPPVPKPDGRGEITKLIEGKGNPSVGMVTRIAAEKGVEYAIDAISTLGEKFPEIKLVIAGPENPIGEVEYGEKINKLVTQNKDRFLLLGNIPDNQMGTFYKTIDLLVCPSINSTESFGIVQVEAMLTGTPVVASDLPGVREVVTKTGMGLLAKPRDVESLVTQIKQVVENKKHYIKPREEIEEIFSMNKTKNFYLKLLRKNSP
jgi:glycosyltransferase involved in cell wall biosynthesis